MLKNQRLAVSQRWDYSRLVVLTTDEINADTWRQIASKENVAQPEKRGRLAEQNRIPQHHTATTSVMSIQAFTIAIANKHEIVIYWN